eukprot:3342125-Lingulodinium_polyedra.AAC.1
MRIGELDERITLLNKTVAERDAQIEELRSMQLDMMRAAEVRHNSIVGEVRDELTSAIHELNSSKEKLEKANQQAQYFSAQLLTTQEQLRKA